MTSKHKFVYKNDRGDLILVKTDAVTCTEVVNSVYYYLLGCSFAKENILDAMAQVVSEYERDKDE